MKPKILNGTYNFIFLVSFFLFLAVLLTYSLVPVSGTDSWRHIYLGELLFKNKTITIDHDPLLFTTYYKNICSVNWLFQIFVYIVYQHGGFLSLPFFQVLVAFLTFYFIFKSMKAFNFLTLLLTFVSLYLYRLTIEVRPHLISFLFLVLYVYIIWSKGISGKRNPVLLCLLQLLWANIHLYFFIGPLLVLLYLGERIVEKSISEKEMRKTAVLVVTLILISLVNPLALKSFIDIFGSFCAFFKENSYYVVKTLSIAELQSPFSTANRYLCIFLLAISFISFIFAFGLKKQKKYLFLWAFFFLFSLYAIRTFVLFALLFPVFVYYNISLYKNNFLKIKKDIVNLYGKNFWLISKLIFSCIFLLCAIFFFKKPLVFLYERVKKVDETLPHLSKPLIPDLSTEAIEFINKNKGNIPERVFNSLNNGSALTFFTGRKAFIDSRGNNSAFLREYKSLQIPFETKQEYFSQIIDKYKLDAFLININNDDIIKRLYLDGRFVLVYLDETVAILVKDAIGKEKINNLRKTDWDKWVQNKIDDIHREKGMHTKNTFYLDAGWVFLALERRYLAKKLFLAALWINPKDMSCYYTLGLCFLKERDYKSAYEYLYKAYKLAPFDARMAISLFIVSKYLGKKEIAEYLSDIIKKNVTRETIENFEKIYEFIDLDTTFIKDLYRPLGGTRLRINSQTVQESNSRGILRSL